MGPGTAIVAQTAAHNPGKVFIAITGFILTVVGFFFLIKYLFTSNISLRSNISPHILSQFPHFTLSLVRDKNSPG